MSKQQEKLALHMSAEKKQITIVGTATAVIAALAVVGLIVISLRLVKLAEHAIERGERTVPVKTVPR